jgi:hypothetical protein
LLHESDRADRRAVKRAFSDFATWALRHA